MIRWHRIAPRPLPVYLMPLLLAALGTPAGPVYSAETAPAELEPGPLGARELPEGVREVRSRAQDRTALAVTVYLDGPAVFRETREIGLPDDRARLIVDGVPERLDPGSVSLDSEHQAHIQALSFTAGNLNEENLLRYHRGEEVRFRQHPEDKWQSGRLLAFDENEVVLATGEAIHPVSREAGVQFAFPELPPELHASAALEFTLSTERGGTEPTTLAYRSDGLTWSAEYQLHVPQGSADPRLTAFARVDNETGVDLHQAAIRFIAASLAPRPARVLMRTEAATDERLDGFPRYRLTEPGDLLAGRSHRFQLFSAEPQALQRLHRVVGDAGAEPQRTQHTPAQRLARWENERDLPPGRITLITGPAGEKAPAGQGRIPGTAAGDPVEVELGPAFTVTAERSLLKRRELEETDGFEAEWQLRVRNRGDDSTRVELEERFPGDWELLEATVEPVESEGRHALWELDVDPDDDVALTYRARVERGE